MNRTTALTGLLAAALLAAAGCRDASRGEVVPEHPVDPTFWGTSTTGMSGVQYPYLGTGHTGDGRLLTAGTPVKTSPPGTLTARGGGPRDPNAAPAPAPLGLAPDQHIGTPSFRPFARGQIDSTGHLRLYEK